METGGTLQQDVRDSIASSFLRKDLPDSRRITVETRGGWVVLRGRVRSWVERAEAQWAAFAAQGVFDVENDIMIGPWGQSRDPKRDAASEIVSQRNSIAVYQRRVS